MGSSAQGKKGTHPTILKYKNCGVRPFFSLRRRPHFRSSPAIALLENCRVINAEERNRRHDAVADADACAFARSSTAAAVHPDHACAVIKLVNAVVEGANGLGHGTGHNHVLAQEAARIRVDCADSFPLASDKSESEDNEDND